VVHRREARHALAHVTGSVPICRDSDIWLRITGTYAAMVEARHSLVHRSFVLTPAGEMTSIYDRCGVQYPNVTVSEQEALCRLAESAASTVLSSRYDSRDRLDLAWSLDLLGNHHNMPALGGAQKRKPEIVIVNASAAGSAWQLNTVVALQKASEVFPGRSYYDIEIHLPQSGLPQVSGRLEEAPQGEHVPLDPSNLPAWAKL
jgi:hypothetical protein